MIWYFILFYANFYVEYRWFIILYLSIKIEIIVVVINALWYDMIWVLYALVYMGNDIGVFQIIFETL